MPSSPRIKKEDMLQAALELVSRDGYAALNIKAVAMLMCGKVIKRFRLPP